MKVIDTLPDYIERISQENRHRLKSCRAAYRLLQGAVISGTVSVPDAKKLLPDIVKYEVDGKGNEFVSGDFANEYFNDIQEKQEALKLILKESYGLGFKVNDRKVLVIDDQITTNGWKQVFTILFDEKLICAINEKQAIEQFRRNKDNILCVLLDLRLPKIEEEGLDLLVKLRELDESVPIIIFSATDSVIYAKQSFLKGAWDYFPKEPEPQFYRTSLQYYFAFRDIIIRVIEYDNKYRKKFWTRIQSIEKSVNNKTGEQYAPLRQRVLFHIQKAFKLIVREEIDKFSLSFAQVNQCEEVILQCALALESLCAIVMLEKRIFNQKLKRVRTENGDWKTILELSLEPGSYLGDKLKLLRNNRTKTNLDNEWFDKAQKLNDLRNMVTHSVNERMKGKKIRIRTAREVDSNIAVGTLENTINLVTKYI